MEEKGIFPSSFCEAGITLILKSATDITTKKKKKHWPEFLMQMDMKILNKILANQIQNYVFKKV